jgi:hypothetical protein
VIDGKSINIFRVLCTAIFGAYFIKIIGEIPDFSSSHGLIDHQQSFRMFWFTRIGFFHGAPPDLFFYIVYGLGLLSCVPFLAGIHVRKIAIFLFFIVLSAYRWNFIVIYVEDVLVHGLLLWWILFPEVDRLFKNPEKKYPATLFYAFLGNVSLIYFISGFTKLGSPMWRNGDALFTILRLRIANFPEYWTTAHYPFTVAGNYLSIAVECLLPVLLLQKKSKTLFWIGVMSAIGLHLGIIATIGIPIANTALLGCLFLFHRLRTEPFRWPGIRSLKEKFVLVYLSLLSLTGLWTISFLNKVAGAAFALLWLLGMAQNYQLFDWIDSRNFVVYYRITNLRDGVIDPATMFPTSPRYTLLQMRLFGLTWLERATDEADRAKMDRQIKTRFAGRFCRTQTGDPGLITVEYIFGRIDSKALYAVHPQTLMKFVCREWAESGAIVMDAGPDARAD